jgi:hypothetical protein
MRAVDREGITAGGYLFCNRPDTRGIMTTVVTGNDEDEKAAVERGEGHSVGRRR